MSRENDDFGGNSRGIGVKVWRGMELGRGRVVVGQELKAPDNDAFNMSSGAL